MEAYVPRAYAIGVMAEVKGVGFYEGWGHPRAVCGLLGTGRGLTSWLPGCPAPWPAWRPGWLPGFPACLPWLPGLLAGWSWNVLYPRGGVDLYITARFHGCHTSSGAGAGIVTSLGSWARRQREVLCLGVYLGKSAGLSAELQAANICLIHLQTFVRWLFQ